MDGSWITHDVAVAGAAGEAIQLLDREWLLTNGAGAFAMGTLPGINTRRYHGLFVPAARPPVARVVALNQMIERLVLRHGEREQALEFSTCAFRNLADPGGEVYTPPGHQMLRRFERGASVRWSYGWGQVEFTRELRLHWKTAAATLVYRIGGLDAAAGAGGRAVLRLGPLVTLRDFHSLLSKDQAGALEVQARGQAWDTVMIRRGMYANLLRPTLTLRCRGARFTGNADWWYGFHYRVEAQRGQADREDNFLPGWFELELPAAARHEVVLTAAWGDEPAAPADERARLEHLGPITGLLGGYLTAAAAPLAKAAAGAVPGVPDPGSGERPTGLARLLALASDDFVVERVVGDHKLATIIAGYPWFADWGRDTFIALPGLLLATGRFDEARSTLRAFAQYIREGLVPNVFDDYKADAAQYNTVDASLWFIHAAMEYLRASGDGESWRDWLAGACSSIIEGYLRGTSPPGAGGAEPLIRMAGDGLITAGHPGTQLTWMDAAYEGRPITPRHGKAVEINALWYHALAGMAELAAPTDPKTADHYQKLCSRIGRSFPKLFWDESRGYLADTVWADADGREHADASLRPNQIFAVSLPHSPLARKRQERVLAAVRAKLLTPMGLRTLAPDEPNYHGRVTGGMREHDEAYHQGTAWPWLTGAYCEAVLRLGKFSDKAKAEAAAAVAPLLRWMTGPGLGQLDETFEGDVVEGAQRPSGCPAQAWSVAEVARVVWLLSRKS